LPKEAGLTGRGLVTGWRYGLFARGRSRIVLDAAEPVKIDKAFVLPAVEDQPARLVVDLVRTSPQAFRDELQRTALTREASNDVPVVKADRLPDPAAETRRQKPVVMLDPGHGGVDSGTISSTGAQEKDVVLAFAFELKKKLEATGKVEVMMTRDDDRFIPLADRVKIARDQTADLFVSIHADSVRQDDVRGATVYTLSERASDQEAAALAAKENASDAIAGLDLAEDTDEVSDILVDLTRRETKNFSAAFANNLVSELSSTTRMIRNPHRSARFLVLRAHDVPSVLVEIGYLSNEQDEKLLTSEAWRERVSAAVSGAILRFFGQKFAGLPAAAE
jgi:N-acetylmuramoyl-L-alanine amidase